MIPLLSAADINSLLESEFPQLLAFGGVFEVVHIGPGTATLRFTPNETHLRHGGTISGPSMFALADVGAYVALLAHVGPVVSAVTANLNIAFLHRPDPVALDGVAKILKIGRTLAVIEVAIERTDNRQLIAQATATYAIPRSK